MLGIRDVAARVKDAAIGRAEFSVVAMRVGQTLHAIIVGFATEAVGAGTSAAGGTGAAGTVTRHRARLPGISTEATHATLRRSQTRGSGDQPAIAGFADDIRSIDAVVRRGVAGFHAGAIGVVVAIAVEFALYAKTLERLATKLAGGAAHISRIHAQSGALIACFLPVAVEAVVAVQVGRALDASACGRIASKTRRYRAMRVARALHAGIERFIALGGWRLAAYRVDGAGLSGLVAEINPVAKQVVAVGCQAGAYWAVCIACTNLPNECSTRANPLPAAPRVAVLVLTLPENIADARPAKVCRQVAVRVRSAASTRPQRGGKRAKQTYGKQKPVTSHKSTALPQTKGSVRCVG